MRKHMVLWAAVFGASLLIAGIGRADDKSDVKMPAELALVPRDGTGFISIRVAAGWEKAEGLRKMAKDDPFFSNFTKDMDREMGGTPADIERMTLVFPAPDNHEGPVGIVTLVKPYNKAKFLQKFVPNSTEKKTGERTHYVNDKGDKGVYLVNDRTFVVSSPKGLEAYLAHMTVEPGKPVLDAALSAAAGKHDIVGGFNLAEVQEIPPIIKPIFAARGGVVTIDVTGKNLTIEARFPYESEEAAKQAEKVAKDLHEQANAVVAMGLDNLSKLPPSQPQKAIIDKMIPFLKDAQPALKAAKLTREGKEGKATLQITSDDPATGAVCTLFGLVMGTTWQGPNKASSPAQPIKPD